MRVLVAYVKPKSRYLRTVTRPTLLSLSLVQNCSPRGVARFLKTLWLLLVIDSVHVVAEPY